MLLRCFTAKVLLAKGQDGFRPSAFQIEGNHGAILRDIRKVGHLAPVTVLSSSKIGGMHFYPRMQRA